MHDNQASWLSYFLRGLLILFFLLLVGKLVELQIIKGHYYRALSDGNRIRRIPIPAPRGKILARDGSALADNKEVKMGLIFNEEGGYEVSSTWATNQKVEMVSFWNRVYPQGSVTAHLVGYVSEVGQDKLGKVDSECSQKGPYKLKNMVGVSGLEAQYNCQLTGIDGEETIEENARGEVVRTLGKRDPIPGNNLTTNLDLSLQQAVAKVFTGEPGAAIATDAKGGVLAFYSSPSFDPNNIAPAVTDPKLPLFNRVISGLYQPGSVFKPLMAIAGLESKTIDENYFYNDTGIINIDSLYGKFSYTNWYFTQNGRVEGPVNVVRALTRSTDTFFYELGGKLGIDKIVEWSKKLKLDQKSGIDLGGEIAGFIPTPEWKEQVKKERWFLGNTYHFAIGQGDLLLTPILINNLTQVVASNGKICSPRIVGTAPCQDLKLDPKTLQLVKEGMQGACATGGTGFTFFNFTPIVACKTGTAETGDNLTTHSWFTVFAPVENPRIAMTILVEKGGEGSRVAGAMARNIFDAYFGGNKESGL